MDNRPVIGIEAGGTKWVLAWGCSPDDLYDHTTIATEAPLTMLPNVLRYIDSIKKKAPICAIGLGMFGPLELNPLSPTYGSVVNSPKLAWNDVNVLRALEDGSGLPVAIDTDVNAAAYGEHRWGAAQGLADFIYLTIGTGVGGGVFVNGNIQHGARHPELGHMMIPRYDANDTYPGICPYHSSCLEGLASGEAIKSRWQVDSALELPASHQAWDIEAFYLSNALMNCTLMMAPQKIILGGGVMQQAHLLAKIRVQFHLLMNQYMNYPELAQNDYIVLPKLKGLSGVCGAFELAYRLLDKGDMNDH